MDFPVLLLAKVILFTKIVYISKKQKEGILNVLTTESNKYLSDECYLP